MEGETSNLCLSPSALHFASPPQLQVGCAASWWATSRGHVEALRVLLVAGANPDGLREGREQARVSFAWPLHASVVRVRGVMLTLQATHLQCAVPANLTSHHQHHHTLTPDYHRNTYHFAHTRVYAYILRPLFAVRLDLRSRGC